MNASQIAEALLASSADAIVATDRDGIIRHWNPGAECIWGAEAVGQSLGFLAGQLGAGTGSGTAADPLDNLPLCTRNMFGNISRFLILKPREGIRGNSNHAQLESLAEPAASGQASGHRHRRGANNE